MAVGHILVLDDHHGIAVGFQESAQTGHAGVLIFVQQELGAVAVLDVLHFHQVVGKNALAGGVAGHLGLGGHLGGGNDLAAVEHLLHALEHHHDALTARVHHAGLFQHGQLVGGVLQSGLTGGHHLGPQALLVHVGAGGGLLGGQPGDGEDGALGGLHDRLVGGLHAHLQRRGQVGGGGGGLALQRLGKAAEQKAGDNAGVAAGAPQHGGGGGLAGLAHGAVVRQGLQLTAGGAHRHAHVGAGIAIGDREHVQLVHAGALVGDVVRAGQDGVAKNFTCYHCFLLLYSAKMSSTKTSMRATFRPVAHSTSSLTRWVMLWVMVAMFSPYPT